MAERDGKTVAIYHDMRVHEDFGQCAQRLFTMLKNARDNFPGSRRVLYLDVQGHRNSLGAYDADSYEIMTEFLMGFLMPYLSEARTPLCHLGNPRGQSDDLPGELVVKDPDAGQCGPRDANPVERRSKPTLRAIADYLGLAEPCCMICWDTPVERAHARPVSLDGSNDVRNFALLCQRHHRLAPDVSDSNSFWQWVDWKLSTDGPFSADRRASGVAKETEFFAQVRQELVELYGWELDQLDNVEWPVLMAAYHEALDTETGEHFGVKKKVATHAWALHRALGKLHPGA